MDATGKFCYFISTNALPFVQPKMLVALGNILAERGHRVVLLLDRQKYHLEDKLSNPAVYIWPSKFPRKPRDARLLHALIKQYSPDCLITEGHASRNVILVMGWLMGVPIRANWGHRALYRQVQLVYNIPDWKLRFQQARLKLILKVLAPYFICNSQATVEDVGRHLGIPANRCRVIPWLLEDPQQEFDLPQDTDNNLVLCVARLDRDKSQETLIKALPLLRDEFPELRVEFIGRGPMQSKYESLAQQLDVQDICHFRGFVGREEIFKQLASAYVSVLPSLSEAFGIVLVESMAVGTPVIASRGVGGIDEVVRDEVDAFLFAAGQPEDLAARLRQVLSNRELRDTLSRIGRQRFLDTYEISRNLERVAEAFEQLVSGTDKG